MIFLRDLKKLFKYVFNDFEKKNYFSFEMVGGLKV
jgi:hypothetical protein